MTTFADLGLPSNLSDALAASGITSPTPVQAATMATALKGGDVAAQAPTGSGKTLAFGLPLLVRSGHGTPRRPASLVLAPTRELATQIVEALTPLAGRDGLRIQAIFGGVGQRPQVQALRRGVDVVVGCPGRLEDLISQGALDLSDVGFAVVDEADRMADVGFLPAVKRLLDRTRPNRQTLVFSATLGGPVAKLISAYQRDPERHDVEGPRGKRSTARHLAVGTEQDQRTKRTAEAIRTAGSTIVFTRTRHRADRVARQLNKMGITAAPIHGGRSQPQRTKALDALHDGRITALIATDVAARGIHVDDLSCVVHYDPPGDAETYVHRSGRTGRAGAGGVVISLVEPDDIDRKGRVRSDSIPRDVRLQIVDADQMSREIERAADAPAGAPEPAPEPKRNDATAGDGNKARANQTNGNAATSSEPSGPIDEATLAGTIAFFHRRRGFGFIETPNHGEVFVHTSQLRNPPSGDIAKGAAVRFRLGESPKGPQAVDVELV